MRGAIYAIDREKALSCLRGVIIMYSHSNIQCIRKVINKLDAWAEFENGTVWRVCLTHATRRGYKWHECYVDEDIPDNVLHEEILPQAVPDFMCEAPWSTTPMERRVHFF